MSQTKTLTDTVLSFNEEEEIKRITDFIKKSLRSDLHKRGLIVAISGGVDSAVCAALCVKALGSKKVFGLSLPEQDSSSSSVTLAEKLIAQLGIEYEIHDIAPTLDAIECYKWRDNAIRNIYPNYTAEWKNKITISENTSGQINHFHLVVQSPEGEIFKERMGLKEYLQIVAATNYKQRIRKTVEYFHADRLNYAVVGTPNLLEYDQGFFVKNGDGSADIKPIAHLYKTQVYALARYLGLPKEICEAVPTTDTYSMPQNQDEFYFALPYDKMDIALWSYTNGIAVEELAEYFDISVEQARAIYADIESKRKTTAYLHKRPMLVTSADDI